MTRTKVISPMPIDAPRTLNVLQAARRAGVSRRAVYYWLATALIATEPARPGLRSVRIVTATFDQFLRERAEERAEERQSRARGRAAC